MLEPIPTCYIDTTPFPVLKSVFEESQKTKVIDGEDLLEFLENEEELNEEEEKLLNFLEECGEDYSFVIETFWTIT